MLALIASLGGFWISRRALAPVDQLTTAARRISVDNLGQRLEVARTGDELERLGTTWNQMLDRLDNAVQRMRQFTADASHELRTPISIIRTTAELALRRNRDPEEYRKALENVQHEAEWMTQLAEDLLLLARSDSGTLRLDRDRVDIDQLARTVADETVSIAEVRGIAVRVHPGSGGAQLNADERALHRIFSVLLDNAVQHTPHGGTVDVQTSAGSKRITIAVRNTGEGIPTQDLPHIFERFFRGDPARTRREGAGLGLAIARSLAQAQGTDIEVESEPGQGAVFSISFPASQASSATLTPAE
jgi:heavy metal sensor kinase